MYLGAHYFRSLSLCLMILCANIFFVPTYNKALAEDPAKQKITTNMFDLQYEKIFHLDVKKRGGGIGQTNEELLIVTGDGKIRVIDLKVDVVTKPSISLPKNNEELALLHAKKVMPEEKVETARTNINKFLRYDDVLVFSSGMSRYIALSYGHFDGDIGCFTHRISLLKTTVSKPLKDIKSTENDWNTVFTSKPCFSFENKRNTFAGHQSGGRLDTKDAEKGEIVLALGDYEFDGVAKPSYPQDMGADYGKIWQINVLTGKRDVVSIGLRNPQGITVDSEGSIWSVEHGPFGGDELNLSKGGENFGWPHVTHGISYNKKPWRFNESQGRHKGFDYPVFSWVPSIAPSNIDQISGFHPFWEGDLLVFTLKTKSIHRLRVHDGKVIFDEPIGFKERIRYGTNHKASKSIYLWTDQGNVFRVRPAKSAWEFLRKSDAVYKKRYAAVPFFDPEAQGNSALDQCMDCHSGQTRALPTLRGILGKAIASSNYRGYSDSLIAKNGVWTKESMRSFLKNPQQFAPGTSMPDPGLTSDKEIDKILHELSVLD